MQTTTNQAKVVVISGASSGIGEAAASAFQRTGATVFGLTSSASSQAAARERHPEIHWLAADVAERAQVQRAVDAVLAKAGRIDALVNNAGIYKFAPLEASDDALIESQLAVNVKGLIYLTQAALPALKKSQGTITNVSSTSARKAMGGQSIYAATKAAVEALTRSWAVELAPAGVRVNAIAPGPTDTPGIANLPFGKEVFAAMKQQILEQLPLRRTASSDEIARWLVILSSSDVAWVTGQVFGIDGGLSVT